MRGDAWFCQEARPLIVECLTDRGLIVPILSEDCVLGGQGYPAGPKCRAAYAPARGEYEFWELLTSGVGVHCEPWINAFGFPEFDGAQCPRCGERRGDDFLQEVGGGFEAFEARGEIPLIACSACGAKVHLHEWKCDPHLGFVHLAVVFWNWPPFSEGNWKLDVPGLIEGKLGHPLLRTFGRV